MAKLFPHWDWNANGLPFRDRANELRWVNHSVTAEAAAITVQLSLIWPINSVYTQISVSVQGAMDYNDLMRDCVCVCVWCGQGTLIRLWVGKRQRTPRKLLQTINNKISLRLDWPQKNLQNSKTGKQKNREWRREKELQIWHKVVQNCSQHCLLTDSGESYNDTCVNM